jgi:hypothetical protein
MNTTTATTSFTHSVWHPVPCLDETMQWAAKKLSKVSRVSGAGAFWHQTGAPFVDAWTELQEVGSGDLVVRLGRLELVASWRAPHPN